MRSGRFENKSANKNFTITSTGNYVKTEQNFIGKNKCVNANLSGGVNVTKLFQILIDAKRNLPDTKMYKSREY